MAEWPGNWQGEQGASPFANMAMRVTASATVTATLEAVSGSGGFADMAMLGQGSGSLSATLAGGDEVVPVKFGGSGPAFRPKSKRHASPYADTRETAAELETRATLDAKESDISADIPPLSEPRKSAPRKAERPDRLRDILADTEAAAAAQGIMADALRGVEAELRAAIAAQEMDEDEAIALVLILAEA